MTKLNPLTGLPMATGAPSEQKDLNPLTGKPLAIRTRAQDRTSPLTGTLGMPGSFEDYNGTFFSPATPVSPFIDIDEQRARNQSTWDKWGNGLTKAGATFVGAVAENTVGYAFGLVDYIASGFEDFGESMTNNAVGRNFVDPLNNYARENLPNYQTREERAEQGTLAQLGNANFWADTFMNGAAYSLGSVASAYLTGGVGALSGIGRAVGATSKISKGLAAYRASKAAQAGVPLREALKKGAKLRAGTSRLGKGLGYLEGGAMMSIGESAVEAREIEDRIREELIRDYQLENGLSSEEMIPAGEMADINSAAQEMGSLGFDANMGILMPTNLITFHGMLRPMQLGKDAIWGTNLIKEGGKKVLRETVENLPGWSQRAARFGRTYARPAVVGAASEGFQESSQYAISEGLTDFTTETVEELGSVDAFNAMRNGRTVKALGRVANDFTKNSSTPEGREQAMVGALIGLLTGGVGGARANRAKDERTKKALEYFNNFDSAVKLQELAKNDKAAKIHLRAMELAEQQNDAKAYNDAKFRLIRQMALTHMQNGTFDAFIERLEDAKDLSQDEFNSLFGRESKVQSRDASGRFQTVDVTNKERIDDIVQRAKDLKANWEMVEDMYPSKTPKGGLAKLMTRAVGGKQRLQELREQENDERIYKNAMILSMSESKDSRARAEKSLRELAKLDPELNVEEILDSEAAGFEVSIDPETGEERVGMKDPEELQKQLQDSVVRAVQNGESGERARKFAQTAFDLLNDRNNSIRAFQQLEESPENRDIFVSREKERAEIERRRIIDKQADDIIGETNTYADLVKAEQGLDEEVSESARARVKAEKDRRYNQVRDYRKEFEYMSPEEVKSMDTSGFDPLKKEAWDQDVASGRTEAKKRPKASKNARKKTEQKANKRGQKAEEADKQKPANPSDVRGRRGRAKKAVDQTNSLSTRTTRTSEQGVEEGLSGEYEMLKGKEGQAFVLVDANGNEIVGERQAGHRLDGNPIITGRQRLADPEVGNGTEVTLVAIENDWWRDEATEEEKADPTSNLPIYVKIGDDIVGVLNSGHTALREAVVEQWKAGNNEAVTTTVNEKLATNLFSAGRGMGLMYTSPYFYNPTQTLGADVIVGVVTRDQAGNLRYTLPTNINNEEAAKIQADFAERGPQGMVPGQIFYVVKNPYGKYQAAAGSTANLSEADQAVALQMMEQGNLEGLKELVGTNIMYDMDGKILQARQAGEEVVYTFNAVDENGNKDPNVPDGIFIQASQSVVKKAREGTLTLADLNPTERAKLLVKVTTTTTERGIEVETDTGVTQEFVDNAEYVVANLGNLINNIVANKKYQVSIENLSLEGGYVDSQGNQFPARNGVSGYMRYLTEGTQRAGQASLGSPGIIGTTTKSVNGSPFIDIGLTFSGDFAVNGNPVQAEDQVPEAPTNPEEAAPETPAAASTSTTQSPNAMFGEDTGPQVTEPEPQPETTPDPEDIIDGEDFNPEDFGLRYTPSLPTYTKLNKKNAQKWLRDRGIPVSFYDQALRIGDGVVHGYMERAGVNLWTQGEVGTEYHESFHFVFRTLLNDKQRKALYAEAKRKFNITKEELAQLRKLNPNLNTAQLNELALEERMAEEFRDYVLTIEETAQTLPQKIRKFFKDLYNFIKALFINPVGMRQLYSLIESNRIPKNYLRNKQTFGVDATAFAYNEDIHDADFHKELQNTMTSIFLQGYNHVTEGTYRDLTPQETRKLIGDKDNKGVVAEFFLKNSFRYQDTKKRLSTADLARIRQRENSGQPINELWAELGIEMAVPTDTGLPGSLLQNKGAHNFTAGWFRLIHRDWVDQISEDKLENIEKFGFRTIMLQGLTKYGFNVQQNRRNLENEARDDVNDEVSQFDKIYALGAMEFNPMDKVSGEVRRRLANIKSSEPNALGMTTFVNIDDIVRLIIPATSGTTSLNEMISALEKKSVNFPQLLPVIQALKSDYTAQEQANFRKVFSLEYNTIKLIEETYTDETKLTRIINSNRKSSTQNAIDDWRRSNEERQVPKPGALFSITEQDGVQTRSVNNEFDGQDRGSLVANVYSTAFDTSLDPLDRAEALGLLLHYMGLNLGVSPSESAVRMQEYIEQSEDPRMALVKVIDDVRPTEIVRAVYELNIDSKTGALIGGSVGVRQNPVDFFTQQSNRVKNLAEIKALFESPLAMSLIDGAGKSKFPYNLPTPLTAVLNKIQGEETDPEFMEMLTSDEFFNALGEVRYQSLIKRLIDERRFEIESFAIDVLKHEDEETSNIDYKNASARESLIMRLEMYANSGNQFAYYALPVQETRGRMDFIKMPRFTSGVEMRAAGIGDVNGARGVIKGLIIQDLIRINRDKAVIEANKETPENLIQDYHTGAERYKTFQLTGVEDTKTQHGVLSDLVGLNGILSEDDVSRDTDTYKIFHSEVDKLVDKYLEEYIPARVAELKTKINDYNLNEEGKSRLPLGAINKLGGLDKFLTTFAINDITARLEMAKLFRGGIALSKNTTDFYKRMGLINTPGSVFMMRGESAQDPGYGMLNKVREATISEIRIVDAIHDEIADNYRAELIEQGVSEQEATDIADKYRTLQADATDAQAYISPQMWRAIQEGEGLFTPEDAAWFANWEKGGAWKAPYTAPFKMFVENHRSVTYQTENGEVKQKVVDMDKNSYVVLTPEFVKGKPALQQMYDKMQEENIHVINTISAKKGAKRNVKQIDPTVQTGIFDGLTIVEQDGKNYRKPQDINDKKTDLVRLNRQIRKNMLNNVFRDQDYFLNRGIDGLEEEINGQDMLDEYHNVFEEILQIQMGELKAELGYDKLIEAIESSDPKGIEEARMEIFKRLRNLFLDENIKRDRLTDNIEAQLQLVVDESGVDFALPLAFPAYQDQYQNLFFSVFKNRVLKTMMNGKEVVQVASPGGMITDENGNQRELRYLNIEEDKNGKRIVHAEVMINPTVAKRLGLKPGDDLSQVPEELLRAVGYRIPHQDKSSTLIMKVVGILPKSYNKSIVVPGNITVMMGSDFDVDKMFVMFPEFAKGSQLADDVRKVTLDNFESLRPAEKGQNLRKAALSNRMLDIMEAIASSPLHLKESITPLDPSTLRDIIGDIDAITQGTDAAIDVERRPFDDPLKEIEMEENYKFSQKLVGIYANLLAGMAVASNGTIGTEKGAGVMIHPSKAFLVDGQTLDRIKGTPETFKILVEHLSAALDAGKEVMQPQLNDNVETVGSKAFLYGIGMDAELVTMLHRTPMVRDFVKLVNIDGLSPAAAFARLGISRPDQKLIRTNSAEAAAQPVPMTGESIAEGLTSEANEEGAYDGDALNLLKNFAISYYAGKDLQNFFSAITPDVLDGIGDIGKLQELVETIESFENSDSMFGSASVDQFLKGDSYGLSKSFFEVFSEMLDLSSDIFLGATASVRNFKDQFKVLTGKSFMNSEEHRAMDRALFYWMMTKEGSPLRSMIRPSDEIDTVLFMTDSENNIVTELARMRERFPEEVGQNAFVSRLVPSTTNDSENNRVYNIQFESLDKMSSQLSSDLTRAFDDLLKSDEKEVRDFGKALIRHQLMSTGFTPGYGSYYNLIPVSFFTTAMEGQTESVAQFSRAQIREAQQDPNYFVSGMSEIIRSMGTRNTNGTPMVPIYTQQTVSNPQTPGVITVPNAAAPAVIAIRRRQKSVDKVELYAKKQGETYVLINQSGITGQLNEINTGRISYVSLAPRSSARRAGVGILENLDGFRAKQKEAISKGGKVKQIQVINDQRNDVSIVNRECK